MYTRQQGQNALLLPVPYKEFSERQQEMEDGETPSKKIKKDEAERESELQIPFHACLDDFASPQTLVDYLSAATGKKGRRHTIDNPTQMQR